MPKNFKYILITILLLFLQSAGSFSQNTFHSVLENDSLYRYNSSLRTLDSLINNAFKGRAFHDTSFYNSYGKAEVIDLDQLIYFSLKNNPELKAMEHSIDAGFMRSKEFSSLPDPMLEAEADFIASNFKRVGEINFYGSQSFPFPGKLSLMEKSAVNSTLILKEEHKQMEVTMINMIKMNFYDLFLNKQKLEINNDSRLLIKIFTSAAESKYAVGKGMQQEIFKSQIEHSKLLNQEIILRQERKNILSNLTKLTKVKIDEDTKISFSSIDINFLLKEDNFNFENFDLKKIVDYAFEHRADLKALKYKILMNETELELSELNRYPDFNLKLGYRIMPFEENNAFKIMLGVTVPIAPWSSDKYEFKIQRDKINIKSSREEFKAKRNEIQNEVINTVNTLQSAKETMKYSYGVLIPQTENSLKSTQYNYENNLTSYLDLLDSYKMYQESKLMFHESLNMYLNIIIELEKITGMNFKILP